MAANIPTLFRAGHVPQFRIELALINLQLRLPSERSGGVEGRATTLLQPRRTPHLVAVVTTQTRSCQCPVFRIDIKRPVCWSDEPTQPSNKLNCRTNSTVEQFKFCVVLCVCHFCISQCLIFLYRFPPLVTSAALVDAKGEVRKEKAKVKELNKEVKRERSCKSATQAREEVPIHTL